MKNDGFDKYNEEISWPIPFGPYRKHKVSLCHFNNAFSDRVFFSRKKLLAKTFWKSSVVISLFVNFQSETLALEDFIRKIFHHSEY